MDLELLDAALAGGVAMLVTVLAVALVVRRRPSAPLRGRTLAGTIAVITVAIPDGGVGTIAHGASGKRSSMPARHVDGGALHVGARVVIVDVAARIARVRPLPADLEEVFRC